METQPNQTSIATKWALISVVTSIVITYIFQYTNIDPASPLKYLSYIPFIAFLLLAQNEFKTLNGGYTTFGQAFSTGFRYSVFTGILVAIFIFIYLTFLSPGMMDKSLEASRAQMEERGMTSSQIDTALVTAKKIGPGIGAFVAAIIYALFGAIIALIGAAIFKKERSPFDTDDTYVDPAV